MKICTCHFGISNFKLTLKSFIFVENISHYSGNYHIGVKCRSILNHFPSSLSKTKICEHVVDHIEGKYAVRTWKGRIPCRVLSISCISQIQVQKLLPTYRYVSELRRLFRLQIFRFEQKTQRSSLKLLKILEHICVS